MNLSTMTFHIPEILSLIGLIQCVYILVYMAFRAGDIRHALIPFAYFLVLGAAFFLDFARRQVGDEFAFYYIAQWAAWFMGPPLAVLLIVQVARLSHLPGLRHLWVLLLLPCSFVAAVLLAQRNDECTALAACPPLHEWLTTFGLVAGGISLLALWLQRDMLDNLHKEKEGQARYWLIITLILTNAAFLGLMLVSFSPILDAMQVTQIRTLIGLALVYLAGTSLFRIYPQSVTIAERAIKTDTLSIEEQKLAARIEDLLSLDKVYQESTYSRTDLARELNVSETVISRIINVHFGKSFPQLLNERRITDARRLLRETDAPVKQIAEDVGFNSMATFNRVFRDMTGQTPTAYRTNTP